jgi:hypothetical protein
MGHWVPYVTWKIIGTPSFAKVNFFRQIFLLHFGGKKITLQRRLFENYSVTIIGKILRRKMENGK